MNESHAVGLAVLRETIEYAGFVFGLKKIRELAKVRIPVWVVDERVLESVRLLD